MPPFSIRSAPADRADATSRPFRHGDTSTLSPRLKIDRSTCSAGYCATANAENRTRFAGRPLRKQGGPQREVMLGGSYAANNGLVRRSRSVGNSSTSSALAARLSAISLRRSATCRSSQSSAKRAHTRACRRKFPANILWSLPTPNKSKASSAGNLHLSQGVHRLNHRVLAGTAKIAPISAAGGSPTPQPLSSPRGLPLRVSSLWT